MQRDELTTLFDQQAARYDEQWSRLAPINDTLHLLAEAVLSELPARANILCIGSGTGAEILSLARRFPEWRFTAVEPSVPMQDVFRRKAEACGILSRCSLHAGYLDTLPSGEVFDAATAFLVSQFILDRGLRSAFFQGIADRLAPRGILISSDLAGDMAGADRDELPEMWFRLMKGGGISREVVEQMRAAYKRDVAILPVADVGGLITRGGFESPVHFFQAGMIHGWYARRSVNSE